MPRMTVIAAFVAAAVFACWPASIAGAQDNPPGKPVNARNPVILDQDVGSGKKFRLSMNRNFQDWGAQRVSASDGFPVRAGETSLRFETREGVCGWEKGGWSDCRNGRSRHELSTAHYGFDNWKQEYWYALSLFLPEAYHVPRNVGNSLFQFLAGGKPSWLVKFDDHEGLFLQREFEFLRIRLKQSYAARKKWLDFVIRISHSTKAAGRFTVWLNGRQVYDHVGQSSRKVPPSKKPYFKFGIYNTGFGKDGVPANGKGYAQGKDLPNLVLYYDEIRFGGTCAELKLDRLGYDCASFAQ